jgi:hypothetical protein
VFFGFWQNFQRLGVQRLSHRERLNYCQRLYTGQSIGGGMVEGAGKNLIGKRFKQTGAYWDVDNVDNMAQLCCLTYSDFGFLIGRP